MTGEEIICVHISFIYILRMVLIVAWAILDWIYWAFILMLGKKRYKKMDDYSNNPDRELLFFCNMHNLWDAGNIIFIDTQSFM